ncbi:MAG TPA: DNA polymerase III subunit epsilon [Casimicrobiaceae bacterium]|nr:DNA polymerase III subunit epsilon [Casimicrobiaceae bacterium]
MRLLVLDTETTGLDPKQGHRVIEIAAVELSDRRQTGRHLHFYLNPEREIDTAAAEVHGMTWEDLKHRPRFADVAAEFIMFAQGAEWVIHNAPFDVAFLDAEFERAGLPVCAGIHASLVDTLSLARESFPGKRNNLDALCERFAISNAHRTLHGALLDAQLLAEVYLAMTRGQETLTIDMGAPIPVWNAAGSAGTVQGRWLLELVQPSADELAAHGDYLEALDRESKGRCVWLRLDGVEEAAA